ncbi:MAG: hypothetical protein Q7R47_04785, partial [Candidatus Diapherotrites archaeon]|nr:hypothetical protein [Candidatus Diapherotrites archaeon]
GEAFKTLGAHLDELRTINPSQAEAFDVQLLRLADARAPDIPGFQRLLARIREERRKRRNRGF